MLVCHVTLICRFRQREFSPIFCPPPYFSMILPTRCRRDAAITLPMRRRAQKRPCFSVLPSASTRDAGSTRARRGRPSHECSENSHAADSRLLRDAPCALCASRARAASVHACQRRSRMREPVLPIRRAAHFPPAPMSILHDPALPDSARAADATDTARSVILSGSRRRWRCFAASAHAMPRAAPAISIKRPRVLLRREQPNVPALLSCAVLRR